ncbi:hypothetical protein V1477_008223 [Vespula maculifrons]|uniref:Uncharacterized protein n=1 Tax=Vespula maculifrons TaxID=7453 RepID=A0ABD2CCD9_VESMC
MDSLALIKKKNAEENLSFARFRDTGKTTARPVQSEDCGLEVEKPAAGALRLAHRRLVELSTSEDKIEEGNSDLHWRLPTPSRLTFHSSLLLPCPMA